MIKVKQAAENTDEENLLTGYAPEQMNLFQRCIYIFFRMVHLISTGTVLPLAIIYVKRSPEGTVYIRPWIGWFLAFGAVIWALIYIVLEQFSYPVRIRSAVGVTAGLLLNAWSGFNLSGFNFFFGAYQVVMAALSAQVLFMTGITVRFYYLKSIKDNEGEEMEWWYLFFLTAVSISLVFLLYGLAGPVITEFAGEKNLFYLGIAVFFFLYQVFSDGVTMWNGSIFNKKIYSLALRNQLHNKWSAFSAFAIILSLLASMIIGMWDMK